LLRTDSAELSDVVEQQRVVELPLNGRFFVNLVALTPGTAPPAAGQNPNNNTFLGARAGQPGIEANGQRPGSNNYTVDGIDNAESTVGNIVIYPPIDAIQEFRVQTSNQEPEFGKNPGATVNVVTRAGTNNLHGDAYEFLRNSQLDARNFFDSPLRPKPPFRLNQYGGTLGGPVRKNRTFLFGYYEGYKVRQAQTYVLTVPTADMRTGNLNALGKPIFDPFTYDPQTNQRQQFANNTIPASRLNPVAQRLMSIQYPLPTSPGVAGNYVWNPLRTSDSNSVGLRADHQIGAHDNIFGRYAYQDFTLGDPSVLPAPIAPSTLIGNSAEISSAHEQLGVQGLAIGWNHIFSSHLVSETRLGFTRENVFFANALQNTTAAQAVGIPNVNNPNVAYSGGMPIIGISGFTSLGESNIQPFIVVDNNFQYTEHMTWIHGRHNLKFGGDVIRRQYNFFQANNQRGNYSFDGSFTSQPGVGNTGSGFGDFLLGYPLTSTLSVLSNPVGQRQTELGAYLEDTWRATSTLTLTLGMRYELFTPRVEIHDRQANFDPAIAGGAVVIASSSNAPCGRSLRCTDYKDLGPRFGFAYQMDSRTVVRGGYGIMFDDYAVQAFGGITTGLMVNPPYYRGQSIINTITSPTNSLSDGVPPVVSVPVVNGSVVPVPGILYTTKYQNPYGRNSYVQQWNFTVEREFGSSYLAGLSYVGNKGTRNMYTSNINQAVAGPGAVANRRPFPAWPDVTSMYMDGLSNYNSLQAKLQKRLSHGISLLSVYTWAKSIDNGAGESASPMIVRNIKLERARSNWDVRQRFVTSGTFELPFGPGHALAAGASGVLGKIVEGWSANPILTLQGGLPFTPGLATSVANTGTASRPDRLRSGTLSNRTPDLWFDPTAFATPAIYTFGNSGRNILTGPGTYQLDINFAKNFFFSKDNARSLQFRAEMFNLFNTPQFNNPGTSIGTATAGKITAAGDAANFTRTSRQIQMALKFNF
jgi:outer membrane receptor protein involved in Fe transport